MMKNDQFGQWEKSICMGLVNQLLSQITSLHKELFPFELLESNVFFLCQIHIDLNCNLEEYLYNISLSERQNDSTYSMASWLRFPIAGSKGPCRFWSMSSLQDPHIFQPTGLCTFLSINSSYFLKNTTPRELHICWYRRRSETLLQHEELASFFWKTGTLQSCKILLMN